MGTRLFVANFGDSFTNEDLEKLFSQYGQVVEAEVWVDFETGKSRGFGFVEMRDKREAESAMQELNGRWLARRRLKVTQARSR